MDRFIRLPQELKHEILSYIKMPSDLRSLCLVSKDMSATATPALYRVIILDRNETSCLSRIMRSSGLPFIRVIRILHCNQRTFNNLSRLIERLPKDSLTKCDVGEWTSSSPLLLNDIWQSQKRLRNLRWRFFFEPERISAWSTVAITVGSLAAFTELSIKLAGEHRLGRPTPGALGKKFDGANLPLNPSRLRKLKIEGSSGIHDMRLSKIFPTEPFERLTHLTLYRVFFEQTLRLKLNCPNLEHLALVHCDMEPKCSWLSSFTLKSMFYFYNQEHSKPLDDVQGLVNLLNQVCDLEVLAVRTKAMEPRSSKKLAAAIGRHTKSLTFLIVNNTWHSDLAEAVGKCEALCTLGLFFDGLESMTEFCEGLPIILPNLVAFVFYIVEPVSEMLEGFLQFKNTITASSRLSLVSCITIDGSGNEKSPKWFNRAGDCFEPVDPASLKYLIPEYCVPEYLVPEASLKNFY